MINDPKGLIDKINSRECDARIEIGCGPVRSKRGYITVDLLENESVDVRADIFEFLDAVKPGTISAVYASHFIEHIGDLGHFMSKLAVACQPHAVVEFVAPHYSNPFYYSDYTHKSFFGLYSFCYLANDRSGLRRGVPKYGLEPEFELTDVELKFKSYRPNYLRHGIKRMIEKIVNLSSWTKEFYEEMLVWIIPCYEVCYLLRRLDGIPPEQSIHTPAIASSD